MSLPAFGVGSDFLGCVKFGTLRSDLSHAVSIECKAVSIVDEAVEDGVGDGRIGDDIVPIFDRHLAGDDGRSALVAIVCVSASNLDPFRRPRLTPVGKGLSTAGQMLERSSTLDADRGSNGAPIHSRLRKLRHRPALTGPRIGLPAIYPE